MEPGALRTTSKPYGIVMLTSGWMLWAMGVIMTLGPIYYIYWEGFLSQDRLWWEYWEFPAIFYCMLAGGTVAHFGQQARLTGRRHLTKIASFPGKNELFVLYLRSFHEDVDRASLERTWLRPEALTPWLFVGSLFLSGRSLEEHLIACVRHLGRVIAVGSPAQRLSPAGAQRLYIRTNDWQRSVQHLMSRARLVVIFLDATPGTLWEFVEATRLVHPQRLLLVAPATKKKYEDFRTQANALLRNRAEELHRQTGRHWSPPTLPDYRSPIDHVPIKKEAASGLIYYSADWKPTFSRLISFPLYDVLGTTLRGAARPALDLLATYEDKLPGAQDPSIKEWKRRTMALESLRIIYIYFAAGSVGAGLLSMSPTNNWGLPQDSQGWWVIAVSSLVALTTFWSIGYLVREARLRAVPTPEVRRAGFKL